MRGVANMIFTLAVAFMLAVCLSTAVACAADDALLSERSQSETWHILRQWNSGPLFAGLPRQLHKVMASSRRGDPVWTGIEDGGRVKLDIAAEDGVFAQVIVGFFSDATWSAEPVQVRTFPIPGEYTVSNLLPGTFVIGAMTGTATKPNSLGVHRSWPAPIEIEAGATTSVSVLLSPRLKDGQTYYNTGFRGALAWSKGGLDKSNLLEGRVTGPEGKPIPHAIVQIRGYDPGANVIAPPDTGTDENGQFYFCQMAWPYQVGVWWHEPLPSVLGYRHQYLRCSRVLEGSQTVNFQFDPFPEGTATMTGRVVDQHGEPVQEYCLDASTALNWDGSMGDNRGRAGYRIPFTSGDGSFTLDGLPSGAFTVNALPFEGMKYEFSRGRVVVLADGETTDTVVELAIKNVLYGRVLFEDGTPAVIDPPTWPGAKIRVNIRKRARGTVGVVVSPLDSEGYFSVYVRDADLDKFKGKTVELSIRCPTPGSGGPHAPLQDLGRYSTVLSLDRSKANVITVPRPYARPPR